MTDTKPPVIGPQAAAVSEEMQANYAIKHSKRTAALLLSTNPVVNTEGETPIQLRSEKDIIATFNGA